MKKILALLMSGVFLASVFMSPAYAVASSQEVPSEEKEEGVQTNTETVSSVEDVPKAQDELLQSGPANETDKPTEQTTERDETVPSATTGAASDASSLTDNKAEDANGTPESNSTSSSSSSLSETFEVPSDGLDINDVVSGKNTSKNDETTEQISEKTTEFQPFASNASMDANDSLDAVSAPLPEGSVVVEAESNQSGQGKVGSSPSFGEASGGDCVRMWGDPSTTLSYTVTIPTAGSYEILVYTGSIETDASTAKFGLNGEEYIINVPAKTDGWYASKPVRSDGVAMDSVKLEAGELTFDITAGNAVWGYFDKIEFIPVKEEIPEPESPETVVVEAENNQSGQGQVGGSPSFGEASGDNCIRMWGDSTTTLSYAVEIPVVGNYKILVYVGSIETYDATAKFILNGSEYSITVPANTNGWYAAELMNSDGSALGAVALETGVLTFSIAAGNAVWGYFDKIEFVPVEEEPTEPEIPVTFVVEAEANQSNQGLVGGSAGFGEASGGDCVRMWGDSTTILSYVVDVPAAGNYKVLVYVGSIETYDATAKFMLNGEEYGVIVPASTSGWYASEPIKTDGTAMGAVALEAGELTFNIAAGNAVWSYFDKIEFILSEEEIPDPDPKPDPIKGIIVESENGMFSEGLGSGADFTNGDGNFASLSGGRGIRMYGGPAKIDYTVEIPVEGYYDIKVYVGSREGNAGRDRFILDEKEYYVTVPDDTAPNWHAASLEDMSGAVVASVKLDAGRHTFSIVYESAAWCYYDMTVFKWADEQNPEPEPEPEPDPVSGLLIEAESGEREGAVSLSVKCDNHFPSVSGNGIRMQSGEAAVSYIVDIPVDGLYDVAVYVGSIEGNSGRDKFVLDDVEYYVTVPLNTKPDLVAAPLETITGQEAEGIKLTAGRHAFKIVYDGAAWCYYDKIIFRLSENQNPDEKPDPAAGLVIEAEKGRFTVGRGIGADISDGNGNFTDISGGSCVRMYGGPAQLDYAVNIPVDGYYQVKFTVGSLPDNSGRDKFLLDGDTYYVSVPAGASPEWEQVIWTTAANKEAATVWLTAGLHSFSLVYDSAAWCYYDKFEFVPSQFYTGDDVKKAIDALPEPEEVEAGDSAAIDAVMRQYNMLSEEELPKLSDSDISKLMLDSARCTALLADPNAPAGRYQYELEDGVVQGNTAVVDEQGAMQGFAGDGYIFLFDGGLTMRFYVPVSGHYRVKIAAGADDTGSKCDTVSFNGGEKFLTSVPSGNQYNWKIGTPGRERWSNSGRLDPQPPAAGFYLEKGWNELQLDASWGYSCYDYFYIEPAIGYDFDGYFTGWDVEMLASALPEVEDVTSAHADAIKQVYQAYMTLPRVEKKSMGMRPKLVMDNARINAILNVPSAPDGMLWYELEEGRMGGNTSTSTSHEVYSEYSGSGYVFIFDAAMEMDVFVPRTGTYNMWLMAGSNPTDDKCDYVHINQGEPYLVATNAEANVWKKAVVGVEAYENGKISPMLPEGGIWMHEGENLFELTANWGYNSYDALILMPGTGSPVTSKEAELLEGQIGPGWSAELSEDVVWNKMEMREIEADGQAVFMGLAEPQNGEGVRVWIWVAWIAAGTVAALTVLLVFWRVKRGRIREKGEK